MKRSSRPGAPFFYPLFARGFPAEEASIDQANALRKLGCRLWIRSSPPRLEDPLHVDSPQR